ncbi:MAG: DUF4980 domain-containing protein [Paramuribaculum sp.]|nr:DUF4980 domain-containing protein [Paramuribaculum sp.]
MKTNLMPLMLIIASVLFAPGHSSAGQKEVTVDHLSQTNTLVRVDGGKHFLLMPIQDSADDAEINVIADGKIDKTIYARLAKSKVDYFVPFDLTPYNGKQVVLDVDFAQGRPVAKDSVVYVCWDKFSLSDNFDTSNKEKYRPLFHHTPEYGWMNDPNGMFYKDGVWHLYYQWNPYGSKWQNMTWGHSTSTDLVNWNHHGAAIEPNGFGAAFSGSSAVDKTGSAGFGKDAVVTMYTTAGKNQTQSLMWSTDNGETFKFYPGSPVITLESEARDPNMFWNEDTKTWTLVLAHALEKEMLIFSSPDMKKWTLTGSFGKGLGAQGGVWECPDLFPLPVEGTNETKWVLLCNINPGGPFGGSATQYFVGDFDGKTFTADTDLNGMIPTKWLDYGKDNYANVSWSDAPNGRRVIMGWMSNWQYANEIPTLQFRSANTLPRDLKLFRGKDGELYVASKPSPEVDSLRDRMTLNEKQLTVGKNTKQIALPEQNNGICEIFMKVQAKGAKTFTLIFSNDKGEQVKMTYSPLTDKLSFDRSQSGQTEFSDDFAAVTAAPVHSAGSTFGLRIFIDTSSMEVFEESGKAVMTNLVFPTTPFSTMTLKAEGGNVKVSDLKVYSLKSTI